MDDGEDLLNEIMEDTIQQGGDNSNWPIVLIIIVAAVSLAIAFIFT